MKKLKLTEQLKPKQICFRTGYVLDAYVHANLLNYAKEKGMSIAHAARFLLHQGLKKEIGGTALEICEAEEGEEVENER